VEYPRKDLISFLMDLRITQRMNMAWQTTCKIVVATSTVLEIITALRRNVRLPYGKAAT